MKIGEEPIVVEQTFSASRETVWEAITQIDKMKQWYFEDIPAFEPSVGFETEFDVQNGDRHFLHLWKVTEVIPNEVIKYDWSYENYPGKSFVTFELSGDDVSTTLRLSHAVTESFPDDIEEFKRESGVAGWTYFIQDRLKDFVESN